ncbi:N-acetyl-alpha-D-glucosaminyl L-malate synthase BshA [Ferrimonas balearica]|uniref:N-acetyl-alpha-D-glucosaminyl L-malate synthase BshA n=1 Tax=Ferrimonas balearica TaxID=44012 RepID=UPI001C998722|nr:N-acetyl-alpha-D-glucosaminyl L-malate synthase BshA [Ferrimonas balearica]MBY5921049.1 N-acetyl-alpha-D-glucosaminyl L-malate synthase BshA [Ferrimonas balearica]MBY5996266.1 N-acetyl-alpha-D-glucosaminyl L-malate synthase BshA [Ferrimonas balearica]
MRIGILCHPSVGGSGLVATELAHGLAETGHEVHVISSAPPFKLRQYQSRIHFHSVEAIHYPLFKDPLYTFALTAKIVEVVDQYHLDVVHAHYSIPHSLCAYLATEITRRPFPIVTTIHGTDVTVVGQDRPLYPLNRFSIDRSTVVTTVSEFQRQHIRRHFALDTPIEVIHNFIDGDLFHPANQDRSLRRTLARQDQPIVMHASTFRPVKNTEAVLKSFALASSMVDAKLVLLGDGPELEATQGRCHQLGIADRVVFVGPVQHIERYLPLADCVLQPSYREAFCMVLLEAMACGVPTVSSNVDGIPEVVEEGVTGYMARPDDVEAQAKALVRLLADPALRQRLGQAGRQRAQHLFCTEEKVQQYLACYRRAIDLLGSNPGSASS